MKLPVLFYKELIQFLRSRGLVLFAVYAFTLDVYLAATGIDLSLKNASFFALDRDMSQASRELLSKFPSPYFNFKGYLIDDSSVEEVLLNDEGVGVLVIPPRFGENLKEGKESYVGVITNGTELSASYLFSAYAVEVINRFLRGELLAPRPPLELRVRIFFNQNASSRVFMAYSELLTVITLLLLLLPASAVVLEKERGNVEMLKVSPTKLSTFIFVKLLTTSLIVLTLTWFALTVTIERLAGVPFHGKELDFLLLTGAYAFSTVGLSLFIASLSENMLQVSQLTILLLIPILYLSGTWTPLEAMPKALQWLSNFSPLRYFVEGAFSIAVKGSSLTQVKGELIKLLCLGAPLFLGGNHFLSKSRG